MGGGAPDIYSPGIQHQNPDILPSKLTTQGIEGKFIVGRDQNRRLLARITNAIKSRRNFITIAPGA
jgi:hypothetical protein